MNCDQHDYIEIACTFGLRVRLLLASGEWTEGVALDTRYNQLRQHCLYLQTHVGEREIALDSMVRMTAVTDNRHFSEVSFG
ncbi:MAG: Rho-binding antiterminator [Pseudomonadales bacterium]|nr:Rho-binding antiterminator [Pseudomonadales bacterium]